MPAALVVEVKEKQANTGTVTTTMISMSVRNTAASTTTARALNTWTSTATSIVRFGGTIQRRNTRVDSLATRKSTEWVVFKCLAVLWRQSIILQDPGFGSPNEAIVEHLDSCVLNCYGRFIK
jgi:hypothetical protein